ncbi:ATP-dependent Clp protease adapter ClpS [Balneolaceae bacterium ANBcel3]|nr:ATP-dependent Clp protease adapter ClpS [Balneolaceae bacterium ANBcel3]
MAEQEMQHDPDVLEDIKDKVSEPPLFKVILLNDDYTTFDFVVSILTGIFNKTVPEAIKITNDVHRKGSGVCGVFTRDIAETKIELVNQCSSEAGFPLQCTIEEA